jgi:phosphoglycolate phosphatase-like HAD superfamily hydrolase
MKLVMFDIDGTLTESYEYDEELFQKAIRETLKIENFSLNWKDYKYVTDSGILNEIVNKEKSRDISKEELAQVRATFVGYIKGLYENDNNFFKAVNGAIPLINELVKRSDIAVAVATGGWEESALFKLEKSGFNLDGIPFASSKDSYDRVKIMQIAEDRAKSFYGVDNFQKTYYVGDGEWDMKASSDIGYEFVGIGEKLSKKGLSMHLNDFQGDHFFDYIG